MKIKKSNLSGARISLTPVNFDQIPRSPASQSYPESTVVCFQKVLGREVDFDFLLPNWRFYSMSSSCSYPIISGSMDLLQIQFYWRIKRRKCDYISQLGYQVNVCIIPCHKYIPFREEKKERRQHITKQNYVRSHRRFAVFGDFICGFAV